MRCDKSTMLLYAVTDRRWLGTETLYSQVEQALRGGVTCVQLREKELPYSEFLREALELKKLCSSYRVPLIINDNIDIAIECDADGVHVGQNDVNALKVRERIGEKMILGVSVQTVNQTEQAEKDGADYLGVGAVFSTSTKPDADAVSRDALKAICAVSNVPVVAIGGITNENIHLLSGSGIDGVALVSAIFATEDIENECRTLRRLSENMVAGDTL